MMGTISGIAATQPILPAGEGVTPSPSAPVVDPRAAERFAVLLQASPPPMQVSPDVENSAIPFASAVQAGWNQAFGENQALRQRLTAHLEAGAKTPLSLRELSALQHEVTKITFQQEVVTVLAKKATDAVSTLIKNN